MAIQYFGLMTMWNSQRSLDSCPLFLLLLGHCDCKCRTRTFSKLDFYQNDGIAEFQKQSSSSKSSVARQNSYAEAVNSWVLKGTIHDQFKVEYEAKCMKHCVEYKPHGHKESKHFKDLWRKRMEMDINNAMPNISIYKLVRFLREAHHDNCYTDILILLSKQIHLILEK